MGLAGIDSVRLATAGVADARRFLDDWGLTAVADMAETLVYRTRNGATVVVSGEARGEGLLEVTWGAASARDLEDAIARAQSTGPVCIDADGTATLVDPDGLTHRLCLSCITPFSGTAVMMNTPGAPCRIDTRAPIHDRAMPIGIGHVVLFVSEFATSLSFYRERLGFILSDSYPGAGAFLRTQARGVHHNAFILERAGKPGLNHIAFTLNDIHEVFGGGLAMSRAGWETDLGPGRHPISSAYFWYFKSPFGGAFEYYADEDFCTASWIPGEFARMPELFTEWAIEGGLDGVSRRQARGVIQRQSTAEQGERR